MWWTVEVRTDSPKPEATIDLKAVIRKATTAEISLNNPLNEPITFEVFYSGDGLLGDATLSLEPKSIGTYSLIYSPLKPGQTEGTIGFLNERVGEFWYDLKLAADENPVQNLDTLACELGKLATHTVNLENPTGQEMNIDVKNSNATNFEVVPDKIVLQAYETQKVLIQYSPSNLDVVESGTIIFDNPHIGKWEYNVAGKGLLPTIMEPQPISTAVGNNTSSMLTFKNPFREPSTVNVHLETHGEDSKIFSLLLKRNKFNIGPLAILQIPYSFSPQTMTESKATIVISMSKQLVWRYPLRGIAESASTSIDYHFKTRARKPLEENIEIMLPGFEEVGSEDTFRYEITVANPQFKGFIERSVFFQQKTENLRSAKDPLVFLMRFEPLRSFKTSLEFVVYKSSGGRWKFNMVFEAIDPEVDDIIVIQSPLQKTSSVSFKLTNHLKAYAEFNAFFTADSAAEFLVYPKTGLLEPYGKEGTNFIVSFTPTEYGKAKVGRLIIQTEEMQWTYEIRGSHPHYKIPEVGGGRIQNKLSKEVEDQMKQKHQEKRNFLRENLKTSKYAQGGVSQKEYSPSRAGGLAGGPSMANFSTRGGNNRSRIGAATRDLSNERQ